jgi:hypothetical protein
VSDPKESARKLLAKLAAEFGAWPQRKTDWGFQKALLDMASDEEVVRIVAQFGTKIQLMPNVVAQAPIDAAETALRRMMHVTAYAMADPTCERISAKTIIEAKEERARMRAHVMAMPPTFAGQAYLTVLDYFGEIHAPLNDPIVERRSPTRKSPGVAGVAATKYGHARGVLARVLPEARLLFGKAGDRVADLFVAAVTEIEFSRDDRRGRFKR